MDEPLRIPDGWEGDGIIARVANQSARRLIEASGVPAVNVSGIEIDGCRLPRVCPDLKASGRLAAEYLWYRGFRTFSYVGIPRMRYVKRHHQAFREAIAEYGGTCSIIPISTEGPGSQRRKQTLIQHLQKLPKPAAILTWSTPQGLEVLNACRWAELLVPEQVAVLSGDDDRLLCETSTPRLSGIAVAAEQIGYQAAALLDDLIHRKKAPKKPVYLPPFGITTRHSTDTLAMDHPLMVQALAFTRNNASKMIQVEDIAQAAGISRRQLERLFREYIGRTPGAEIQRLRIERAKELIVHSDLSVADVAAASGFGTAEYLATLFKQSTGFTPLSYRRAIRGR